MQGLSKTKHEAKPTP